PRDREVTLILSVVRCPLAVATDDGQRTTDNGQTNSSTTIAGSARMRNGFPGRLVAAVLVLGILLPGRGTAAENAADAANIRIGLVGSMFRDVPEPMLQLLSKPFRSLMEDQAGVVGHVVSSGAAENLAQQLKGQNVQLGVFHGFEFA